jgi:hypothetical protein
MMPLVINLIMLMTIGAMLVCVSLLSRTMLECGVIIICAMASVISKINRFYSVISLSTLLAKHFIVLLMFGRPWWVFYLLWKCWL